MKLWELAIAAMLYANIARRLLPVDAWTAGAWAAYALANVCFLMAMMK